MSNCSYITQSKLPTEYGDFTLCAFEEDNGKEHLALTLTKFVSAGRSMTSEVHASLKTILHSRCSEKPKFVQPVEEWNVMRPRSNGKAVRVFEVTSWSQVGESEDEKQTSLS